MTTYDVIVLGAGAMGSAAAYYLAKARQRVLLLEQFEIDHARGSSYGNSRIIRYMYDHTTYIKLMKAAYPLWFALQAEAGETLYINTGGLDFGPPDAITLQTTLDCVRAEGITHEVMTGAETRKRFPQFNLPDDTIAVYQADAGILPASRCVRAHIRLAQAHGAQVQDKVGVKRIVPRDEAVEVETGAGNFSAGRLVITAGAWTKTLLAALGVDLPLTPLRVQYSFFQPANPDAFKAGTLPIFINHEGREFHNAVYGLPDYDGMGLKFAFHNGTAINDLAAINYTPDVDYPERLRPILRQLLPGADGQHLSTVVCLYTMTPDTHFIIDHHPEHRQIIFASPCSGHGFKFSTLFGRILSDLAMNGTTQLADEIEMFRIARFEKA